MRMRAWAVLGLGLLAGCATERWSYSKPGLTPARLDRDLGACRRQSARPQWFAVTRDGQLDQAAITQCMERKGYTSHRDDGAGRVSDDVCALGH